MVADRVERGLTSAPLRLKKTECPPSSDPVHPRVKAFRVAELVKAAQRFERDLLGNVRSVLSRTQCRRGRAQSESQRMPYEPFQGDVVTSAGIADDRNNFEFHASPWLAI